MLLMNYYEQSDLDALMSKYCIGTKHRLGGNIRAQLIGLRGLEDLKEGEMRMLRCVMKKAHIIQL